MVTRAIFGALAVPLILACGSVSSSEPDGGGDGDGDGDGDGGGDGGEFAVGGTVTGLTGTGLELQLGGETLAVSADGAYQFSSGLDTGQTYEVSVASQPAGQSCVVANRAGVVAFADVSDVEVTCYGIAFTVDNGGEAVDASVGDGACAAVGGGCTIRAAVQEANAASAPVLIRLGVATATLDSPFGGSESNEPAEKDLDILTANEVRVVGDSASASTISGGMNTRIFHVHAGANVVIEHVSLIEGNSGGFAGYAARIETGGSLTLRDTVVSSHAAGVNGGALSNAGSLTLVRTAVSDNTAGNGVLLNVGTLDVADSVFAGNTSANRGGAVFQNADSATMTIRNSTFSGNVSNISGSDGGGAICLTAGSLSLEHVTITGNQAPSAAGGGIFAATSATVSIESSIIAQNSASSALDCSGPLTSAGANILGIEDGCTVTAASGDELGTAMAPLNPMLGAFTALGRSSGHEPQAGSPALDSANPGSCPSHDQGGRPRPEDKSACDIGAIEAP